MSHFNSLSKSDFSSSYPGTPRYNDSAPLARRSARAAAIEEAVSALRGANRQASAVRFLPLPKLPASPASKYGRLRYLAPSYVLQQVQDLYQKPRYHNALKIAGCLVTLGILIGCACLVTHGALLPALGAVALALIPCFVAGVIIARYVPQKIALDDQQTLQSQASNAAQQADAWGARV